MASLRVRIPLLVGLAACVASVVLGAISCFPETHEIWFCLNPETGKLDSSIHDDSHYVNGVWDPCHCYDPCGPSAACPGVVDAGPLPPACGDAGTQWDGG